MPQPEVLLAGGVRVLLNVMVIALLVVAVALGLNNFGAAIAIGVGGVDRRTEVKVATVFGLCDVVMPAIGMLIGTGLAGPLGSAARWAGAGILFVTAVWGLIEALRGGDDAAQVWHGWRLLVSGAALSLDDLAVGLALGTVRYPIVLAVALFGLMSFVMSIVGLKLGGKLGAAAGEHGEVVGAIVLIGIAGAMAAGWLLPGERGPHPSASANANPVRHLPSVRRPGIDASSSPSPRPTGRTDLEASVATSRRGAPPPTHDDARDRKTRPPTTHNHRVRRGPGRRTRHGHPRTHTRHHQNTTRSRRPPTRHVTA